MTYSNTYSSPSSPTNFNPFSGMGMRKGGRPSLFPGSGDGSTLNLDFTTMGGVLDPRLTFSRASTATFVNSSGYVAYADTNLFANSQFSGTSQPTNWDKTTTWDGIVSSPGERRVTTDATGASKYLACPIAIQPGLTYSASVYVSEVSGQHYANTITPTGSAVVSKIYRNGVNVGSIYNTAEPGLITTVFSQPSGTTNSIRIGLGCTGSAIINGVCQFSQPRCVPGDVPQPTYFASPVATSYHAPRFDYSPTNIGEPRGLLIEGSSINACTYSEDFANAAWSKNNATQTPASGTSPDNTNTATLLAEIVGYGKHSLERSITVTAGNIYTFSVFLKEASSNSRRYACVQVADGQATAARNTVVFDLQTGTVTANGVTNGTLVGSPTDVAHSITSYKDGWYRVTVTMKFVSSPCYPVIMLSDISTLSGGNNQPFYTAASPVNGFLIYGAQVELGSGASSLIPTGASQVTRTVDTCYMSGISSWYNESAGTVISNLTYNGMATDNSGIELSVGTGSSATNRIGIRKGYVDYYSGGVNSAEMYPTVTSGNVRIGTAYSLNDFAMCSNGGTMRTDGSGAVPVGLNTLKLYADNGTSGLVINGLIKSIKYFPTRLSNAQLQTLTTP